jgi:MoxR-like ATPase
MVVATQNPIDMEGTYRLPEAQLDRFLMRLSVGYPDPVAEVRVLLDEAAGIGPEKLRPVLGLEALRQVIAAVRRIHVDEALAGYAVSLAAATRGHPELALGASPRGSVALVRAARAFAATHGREYVTPDDLKQVATPVLAHRLILKPEAELRRRDTAGVLAEILAAVPAPGVARARV